MANGLTTLPTLTSGSLGATKHDANPVVYSNTILPSGEWNTSAVSVYRMAQEIGLTDGSTQNSLVSRSIELEKVVISGSVVAKTYNSNPTSNIVVEDLNKSSVYLSLDNSTVENNESSIVAGVSIDVTENSSALVVGQGLTIKGTFNPVVFGLGHTITESFFPGVYSGIYNQANKVGYSNFFGAINSRLEGNIYSNIFGGVSSIISSSTGDQDRCISNTIIGSVDSKIEDAFGSVILGGNNNSLFSIAPDVITGSILIGSNLTSSNSREIILGGSGYSTIVSGGLTGSLMKTVDGNDFIIAGANVTVTPTPNGQFEIAASGSGGGGGGDNVIDVFDKGIPSYGNVRQLQQTYMFSPGNRPYNGLFYVTGSPTAILGNSNIYRYAGFSPSITAPSGAFCLMTPDVLSQRGSISLEGGTVRFRWSVYIGTPSDGSQTYVIYSGLIGANHSIASPFARTHYGVFFRYSSDANFGGWECFLNTGTQISASTNVYVTSDKKYTLEAQISGGGSEAVFLIDGAVVAEITGSQPSQIQEQFGSRLILGYIEKTFGNFAASANIVHPVSWGKDFTGELDTYGNYF